MRVCGGGAGGFKYDAFNLKTSEERKFSSKSGSTSISLKECAAEIEKEFGYDPKTDPVLVLDVMAIDCNGKDHSECSLQDCIEEAGMDGLYDSVSIIYGFTHPFKDIIKQFSANGAMQSDLHLMLTAESVLQLRQAQPEDHILRKSKFNDQVVLTLVAIKILNQYYAENRKLWNLVEKKARRFVMNSTGATKETIDTALENLVTTFDTHRYV